MVMIGIGESPCRALTNPDLEMDYEYLIAAAARFIELAGVAVLLPGALLAAAAMSLPASREVRP